jgi:hypothetical protein
MSSCHIEPLIFIKLADQKSFEGAWISEEGRPSKLLSREPSLSKRGNRAALGTAPLTTFLHAEHGGPNKICRLRIRHPTSEYDIQMGPTLFHSYRFPEATRLAPVLTTPRPRVTCVKFDNSCSKTSLRPPTT